MKDKLRGTVFIILISIFLLSGIFLPEITARHLDKNNINQIHSEDLGPAKAENIITLTTIDKLGMINDLTAKDYNLSEVQLNTGTNYTQKTIQGKILDELVKIRDMGLTAGLSNKKIKGYNIVAEAKLLVRKDNPSYNFVFWSIIFRHNNFSGVFYLDDNSGKILKFMLAFNKKIKYPDPAVFLLWAKYLDLDSGIKDVRFEGLKINSGYVIPCKSYSLDLSGAGKQFNYQVFSFPIGYSFGNLDNFSLKYLSLYSGISVKKR